MTGIAWWRPMFPCREHLLEGGPCSVNRDPFTSLVSISFLDIFTHNNWGFSLKCLHSIFIETPSLEGLPTKAKENPSPLRWDYPPLDINVVFPCLGIIIIIVILIIITTIIIIVLTHSKTILGITVEIKPRPAALDFKNLSQYFSRSK